MRSRMKRTTLETVDGATTKRDAARNGAPDGARFTSPEARAAAELKLLAECAELLLTRSGGGFDEILAKLGNALATDSYVCFVAGEGEPSFTMDRAGGLGSSAISAALIETIANELARAGQHTCVVDVADTRAAALRDLGFVSAVVGVLQFEQRVRGAVVLASRSKHDYSEVERAMLDAVVCYMSAALERRVLLRHRESSEQRKREFLTVLAHELRNPLAPVRNALEIIRTNDRGARSPVEYSAYAMIERQLQQIGRLADDLLDANQVVLGEVELERQRVLLDAVIERAANQSRPWIDAARHTLVVDLPREAIALDADPKRLARVFSNLVNNAARRMDRGGRIVVSAELRSEAVAVFVRARGRTVQGDSLHGLFADAVAHDAAAHSEIGDGQSQGAFTAGMTLVKHLVELHGGTVSARTTDDGVAEFEVCLPVVRAALVHARKAAQLDGNEEGRRTTPQRILIADDNADSAESMGMLLRLMGNDVRIASDGLEAVEQAAIFQPDIVLLDIGMPRLDGYEAARRIRDQSWSSHTLIVAVTGWGPSDASEEATAAGFDRHFTKPLDPAVLRRLVTEPRPH